MKSIGNFLSNAVGTVLMIYLLLSALSIFAGLVNFNDPMCEQYPRSRVAWAFPAIQLGCALGGGVAVAHNWLWSPIEK